MKRTTILLAAMLAGATGCGDKSAAPRAAETAAPSSAATVATATATAPVQAAPGSAAPAPSFSGPTKVYDCGAKGQKPCPMQAWMKTVMTSAAASDDGEKLAVALTYVAARVPPGYDRWAALANAGVARAKAGDVDGAKGSCKRCHDAYKENYKLTMRDRPW
jgi:hypothetical protein